MIAARGPSSSGWMSSHESDEENVASEPDSSSSKAAHRRSSLRGETWQRFQCSVTPPERSG
jgi:hypothetical protein